MVSLALLAILAQDSKVSLEIRGERLIVCAPKIAQALGMEKLSIRAPFQEEVAAIRVTNVDRQTLRQKIEQAFRGTFIQRENEWTFEQTIEQKGQEQQGYIDSLVTSEKELIEGAKKHLAQYKPFPQIVKLLTSRYMEFSEEGEPPWPGSDELQKPLGRFAVTLLSRLPVTLWNEANNSESRTVFALYPNSMQKAMPVPIEDLIGTFLTNQTSFAQNINQIDKSNGVERSSSGQENFLPNGRSDLKNVSVSLARESFECTLYFAEGSIAMSADISEGDFGSNYPDANLKAPPISYSLLSKLYLAALYRQDGEHLTRYYEEDEAPDVAPQLRAALLDPEHVEPLSLAIPERLMDANIGKNIVANLHSDLLYDNNLSEEDYNVYKKYKQNFHYDDGWLVVTLEDPYDQRKSTLNRARLGSLLRSFVNGPYPTLEQQATYHELSQPFGNSMLLDHLNLLTRGTATIVPEHEDFLHLYGALTPEERAVATRKPVSIGDLNQSFLTKLHRMVFHGGYLNTEFNLPYNEGMTKEQEAFYHRVEGFISGMGMEPTFRHPNGLDPKMTLQLEESQVVELVLNRKSVAKPGDPEARVTPDSLGQYLYFMEEPLPASVLDNRSRLTSPVLDNESRLRSPFDIKDFDLSSMSLVGVRRVRMVLDSHLGFEYALIAIQPVFMGDQTFNIKSLPEAVKKEVQEGYQSAKERRMFRFEDDEPPPLSTR